MKASTALKVSLALLGFAGNSLLCRLALRSGDIDAATFTTVRLVSGALVLSLLVMKDRASLLGAGSAASALALFAYAAPFSYAYVQLPAATGALILFGCVQSTMIGHALATGERPGARGWLGILLALGGVVGLNADGANAPSVWGALSMALAGIAWGVYSLRGRRSSAPPLLATTSNFVRAVPFTLLWTAASLYVGEANANLRGVGLAIASGTLASGLGYSLWYSALPELAATHAAIVQLLVPVVAGMLGLLLLSEPLTLRLLACGATILLGVVLTLPKRRAA